MGRCEGVKMNFVDFCCTASDWMTWWLWRSAWLELRASAPVLAGVPWSVERRSEVAGSFGFSSKVAERLRASRLSILMSFTPIFTMDERMPASSECRFSRFVARDFIHCCGFIEPTHRAIAKTGHQWALFSLRTLWWEVRV
jgi:hypothetical protein